MDPLASIDKQVSRLGSQLNSPVFSLRCSLLRFDVKDHLKI